MTAWPSTLRPVTIGRSTFSSARSFKKRRGGQRIDNVGTQGSGGKGDSRPDGTNGQPRVGRQNALHRFARGELLQYQLNRDACSGNNRLAHHGVGVGDNQSVVVVFHGFRPE